VIVFETVVVVGCFIVIDFQVFLCWFLTVLLGLDWFPVEFDSGSFDTYGCDFFAGL